MRAAADERVGAPCCVSNAQGLDYRFLRAFVARLCDVHGLRDDHGPITQYADGYAKATVKVLLKGVSALYVIRNISRDGLPADVYRALREYLTHTWKDNQEEPGRSGGRGRRRRR